MMPTLYARFNSLFNPRFQLIFDRDDFLFYRYAYIVAAKDFLVNFCRPTTDVRVIEDPIFYFYGIKVKFLN